MLRSVITWHGVDFQRILVPQLSQGPVCDAGTNLTSHYTTLITSPGILNIRSSLVFF